MSLESGDIMKYLNADTVLVQPGPLPGLQFWLILVFFHGEKKNPSLVYRSHHWLHCCGYTNSTGFTLAVLYCVLGEGGIPMVALPSEHFQPMKDLHQISHK